MRTEQSPARSSELKRVAVGGLIILAAVAMLFWWGFHFHVFNSDIDWIKRPAQLGFPAFIVVGAFGGGYQLGGYRTGFKAMAWTAGLLLAIIVIGVFKKAL
jgi:hypothetical protein